MKRSVIIILILVISQLALGESSGNLNYQNKVRFSCKNISLPSNSDLLFVGIKGLANVSADTYVAIFSVTQVGKTAVEVNTLIDKRISQSLTEIKTKKIAEFYINLIYFVPAYEAKKVFNKKDYNEIPKGLELKKISH